MSERLHYFAEASTPVSFDCDESEIDSDIDDLTRRPISDADRAKQHARQLQLWSDEARRRRSVIGTSSSPASPSRRPSMTSIHDMNQLGLSALPSQLSAKLQSPEMRARLSADRSTYLHQNNLSERTRSASNRVSRSASAKNLKIRITPSSSTKSLLSDIESELGAPISHPHSPVVNTRVEENTKGTDRATAPIATVSRRKETVSVRPPQLDMSTTEIDDKSDDSASHSQQNDDEQGHVPPAPTISRKMSFTERVKKLTSWRRLLRR